jgi:hypothetical protein
MADRHQWVSRPATPRSPFVDRLGGFRRCQVDTIGDDLAIAPYFDCAERGHRNRARAAQSSTSAHFPPHSARSCVRDIREGEAMGDMLLGMLRATNTSNLVYHYTSASVALEFILHKMKLRLRPVEGTNDPAEGGLPSPVVGDEADSLLFFELEELVAGRKLACFSRDRPGSIYDYCMQLSFHGYARDRMWAQYADRHRGVCLFFDCEALEFAFQHEFRDRGIALAGDVRYQSESPFTTARFDKAEYARLGRPQWLRSTREVVTRERSFVKRSDWESEQEYRLVFVPLSEDRHPHDTIWIRGALAAICVGNCFPEGLLPCIRAVCDREKINAFRLQYIGDPRLELLHPTEQPHPSTIINLVAGK